MRGKDFHWYEGERGRILGECQEKYYHLLKRFENFINHQLSLVKNKLESSEVIFFLYSKQVPTVSVEFWTVGP